jgi:hypothetical protein
MFGIDNQMMRMLYSVNKMDDPIFQHEEEIYKPEELCHGPMQAIIEGRTSFYYNWKIACRHKCCRKKCCLCCRHKETPADRIFEKARQRLTAEIDLLHILKQLRTNAFMA